MLSLSPSHLGATSPYWLVTILKPPQDVADVSPVPGPHLHQLQVGVSISCPMLLSSRDTPNIVGPKFTCGSIGRLKRVIGLTWRPKKT